MLFDTGRNGGRTYRLRLQDDRVLTIPITVAERVRAQRLTATRSAPVSPLSPPTEHFDLPRLTVVYAPRSGVVLEVCDADREVIYAHPA